eukprot:1296504-Karenia_brevis.AAC.1
MVVVGKLAQGRVWKGNQRLSPRRMAGHPETKRYERGSGDEGVDEARSQEKEEGETDRIQEEVRDLEGVWERLREVRNVSQIELVIQEW